MKTWRRAPLYVEAHDLALWLELRWVPEPPRGLVDDLSATGRELLFQIGRALSFPESRLAGIELADEAALRLRLLLRLALEARILGPEQLRHALERVERIGRMLGGWRRDQERSERSPSGIEPP